MSAVVPAYFVGLVATCVWKMWRGYQKDCRYVKDQTDKLRKYSCGDVTPPPRFDDDPPRAVNMYCAVFKSVYQAPLWPVYVPYKLYNNHMNGELKEAWLKQYRA